MKAVGEITNINVRVGPTVEVDGKYEVAVNCVASDRKTMIVKCLSPEVKFTHAHKNAIKQYLTSLGFSYDWESKRKELGMSLTKKKIPHVSEAKSDADHLAAIKLVIEQAEAGHIAFKNVSFSQTDLGNGEVQINASLTRYETNPNESSA